MEKIELEIVALSHSVSQTHNYAVVLGEVDGKRRLPIVIGGFEAQAIAVAIEDMMPTRPLTHDLFKNTLDTFEIQIEEVVINNLLDGVFHARLLCNLNGKSAEIDSRTSDAIALAVRFGCPIYTYDFILEAAGVVLEEEQAESPRPKSRKKKAVKSDKPFTERSLQELNDLLDQMIKAENYEKAAEIRDEIQRREQSEGEGSKPGES